MKKHCFTLTLACLFAASLGAQQIADTSFTPDIGRPRYPSGKGSTVKIDGGHANFHTAEGRYAPFARVLRLDGFKVSPNREKFTDESLKTCKILVISNALDSSNIDDWKLPTPSAFSAPEILAVKNWVSGGGRLLLIADHMPFGGAANDLAQAFGFQYLNCFAMDNRRRAAERFFKANGTLLDNEITQGIDSVVTFTGSAIKIPDAAKPLLALKDYTLLSPETAWEFEENTPARNSTGFYQGAYRTFGKGKVVVMGEAAMFSAQLAGPNRQPVGFNNPNAKKNAAFLLNILHWLDD